MKGRSEASNVDLVDGRGVLSGLRELDKTLMRRILKSRVRPHALAASLVVLAVMGGGDPPVAARQPAASGKVSSGDSTGRFADEDAVILYLAQHWTLAADGTVRFREHRRVKLMNSRPIERFGDLRISHVAGGDKLAINKAISILPDSTVLPVPEYSFNLAATDAVAGWPEYAAWQDMIVSFSGIEPGVVLELDYEVTSPSGAVPWLDGSIRLADTYPILERVISVTVPDGQALRHHLDGDDGGGVSFEESHEAGFRTCRWKVANLPSDRNEPMSPPLARGSPRLNFTICPDSLTWASALLSRIERSAVPDKSIEALARTASESETDPVEKVRKVAEKIGNTFNFVESSKAWRGLACRPASDVYRTNYGNVLESGALLLAVMRALDMDAVAMAGVNAEEWNGPGAGAPTTSSFESAVVRVSLPDGAVYVHPRYGILRNPGSWGRRWLLGVQDGQLQSVYVGARGENAVSDVEVAGKITLGKDATATGELRIRATGIFFDPDKLRSAESQKAWAISIVGHVLDGFEVSSHSIVSLSGDMLQMTAGVTRKGAPEKLTGRHVVRFGDGPVLLEALRLPVERSARHTDLRVGTRVRERVDLAMALPDGWNVSIRPASLDRTEGAWGSAAQTVSVDKAALHLTRSISIDKEQLSPAEFDGLRIALNALRANNRLMAAVQE